MQFPRLRPWILATLILVSSLAPVAPAQSTWNGSVSSVWNLASNWTGSVPNASIDAVIPAGTPNSPSTAGVSGATCHDLTVNPGATLTLASGFRLDVARDVAVNGAVSGSGGLRLVGASAAGLGGAGTL